MKNLDIIEGVYNNHIESFNRAINENKGNSGHFEYGYLFGIITGVQAYEQLQAMGVM